MTRKTMTNRILPLLAAGLLLGACDDATGVEEHLEVEGVAIMVEGSELYRYMLDDGAPSTFTVPQGTHEAAFVLLDHDGEPLEHDHDHEHDGEELEFEVNIDDASVLTWTPEDHGHEEEHEHLEFHGELDALQPGATTMELCVPHGDHCDFDADVPVVVTAG